jgi:exosortase E/protease (VPEID-CTERM system)
VSTLLLVEYFIFSVLYDFVDIRKINSPLRVLGYLGTVAPLIMITATSIVLLAGRRIMNEVLVIAANFPFHEKIFLWVIHLLAYSALITVTNKVFSSEGWLVFWSICALTAGGSAFFLALPPGLIYRLFIRNHWIFITSIATGFLAWIAAIWSDKLWNSIGWLTSVFVAKLVTILPGEVIVIPESRIIGTTYFSVEVSNVCSGYQGIGLMAVFMTAYLFFKRNELRFPIALILWPISIVLAWLTNAFRVFALIAVGTFGFEHIALGGFHAKAGWILFCALALGIVAVSRSFSLFSKGVSPQRKKDDTWNPTAVYLLPFLAAIAASMITGLFSAANFDPAYPVRIISAGFVVYIYRNSIFRSIPLTFSWQAFLAGISVAVLWVAMDHLFTDVNTLQQIPTELTALPSIYRILWILIKIFGSCLIIPLIEELAFRGFLLRRLIQSDFTAVSYRKFTWLSFLLSSLAFGLMHGERWIAGIIAGMVYAFVVYRKGRLMDAVVAHAVSNIIIALYVLIFGKWGLWW